MKFISDKKIEIQEAKIKLKSILLPKITTIYFEKLLQLDILKNLKRNEKSIKLFEKHYF